MKKKQSPNRADDILDDIDDSEKQKAPIKAENIDILKAKIDSLANKKGLRLLDIEWLSEGNTMLLRVYLDYPLVGVFKDWESLPKVSIDDCSAISHELSLFLDEHEDLIPGKFTLEVSSPGLDRLLVSENDFNFFKGSLIKVSFKSSTGRKKVVKGHLEDFKDGLIYLKTLDGKSEEFKKEASLKVRLIVVI